MGGGSGTITVQILEKEEMTFFSSLYFMRFQGPLAKEVPGEQVKQLVRALFQNTERRAALLAKIK